MLSFSHPHFHQIFSRWSAALAVLTAALVLPACASPAPKTSSPPHASARPSASPPPSPTLLFADDFASGQLDRSKWATCYPWARESGCTNDGNKELEWYLPQQVRVQDGALQLQAVRQPTQGLDPQGNPKPFSYRSGMVSSANHFQYTYGYLQFKARAPSGAQLWPAVWLLPARQAALPEIDVFEAWGQNGQTVDFFYHPTGGGQVATQARAEITSWHTYGLDWTPNALTWYVDGHELFSTPNPPHEPMTLTADLAVDGSSYPGELADRGVFEVAQVRVWSSRPAT